MAVESASDRLALLADFGTSVTTDTSTITGILDREYREVGGIESEYPVLDCRAEDVSGLSHGDEIIADSMTFEIVGIENDGTGMTLLVLAKT